MQKYTCLGIAEFVSDSQLLVRFPAMKEIRPINKLVSRTDPLIMGFYKVHAM